MATTERAREDSQDALETLGFLNPRQESPKKKFRIAARRMFLTYPHIPDEITHEDVLESLRKTIKYQNYVISKEKHAEKGIHFHVILIARDGKKFDVQKPESLNLYFQGKPYHGNYQPVEDFNDCVTYVCKRGQYKTNLEDIIDEGLADLTQQFLKRAARDKLD